MTRRREARKLDADLLAAIGRAWRRPLAEREVDALAVRLFEHQARHNTAAAAWWSSVGARAGRVGGWADVPPVPAAAYKTERVASFPARPGDAPRFLSSGTTAAARSRVFLEDVALYEAAIPAPFRRHALPDVERVRMLFLAPPPAAAPASSLSFMFGVLRERFGAPGSRFLPPGAAAAAPGPPGGAGAAAGALLAQLEGACASAQPLFVLGPAFALVHALDALRGAGARLSLPPGSRLLQTGGFKGRSREIAPAELVAGYAEVLGILPDRVVNEYGMAEMSSQFYAGADGLYEAPPWVRWRVLDPLTLEPCEPGGAGLLAVWDLANRSGCFALRTEDVAVDCGSAFRLAGRAAGAEPRGCSLDADAEAWSMAAPSARR